MSSPERRRNKANAPKFKLRVLVDNLNVRRRASFKSPVVGVLKKNEAVDLLGESPNKVWKRIQRTSLSGWASTSHLATLQPGQPRPYDSILQLASSSSVAHYDWQNRGVAPIGYTRGMAVVFAKTYCKWKNAEPAAIEMASADKGDPQKDVLSYYADVFATLGMNNEASGADTLRHLFVLLIGLGMQESSGEYFCGRDTSENNKADDTAEAGLFQVSYNLSTQSRLLPPIYQSYRANPFGFLEIFKEGVPRPDAQNLKNWGNGPGVAFQKLTKSSPAFAAEFAAVGLRNDPGHWGPIDRKRAEVRPECDSLLLQIQHLVDSSNLSLVDFSA